MERQPPSNDPTPRTHEKSPARSTAAELLLRAVGDVKNLVAVEVKLAKREAIGEAKQAAKAAVLFAAAFALTVLALAMALFALLLALGATPARALAAGAILLGGATILTIVGAKKMPEKVLPRTQRRVERDLSEVKEAGSDLKGAVAR